MDELKNLLENLSEIQQKIGYHFQNPSLLLEALTHRSFVNECRIVVAHNERLEFLGDSILGLLIADYLYKNFPDVPEGDLSSFRSKLVESSTCVIYAQKLALDKYILLGKGERLSSSRGRETIIADLFEAVIGAIYLDGGIVAAHAFLFNNFLYEIQELLKTPSKNWKALLQDCCQRKYQITPLYKVLNESGPDHSKHFQIGAFVNETPLGYGEGKSKKEAQQAAAADAIAKNFPEI